MVQVWGALAPTRLLLFFLLVTLGVQDAQAAPWRARTLAVPVSKSHRVSQVHHVQQPHGDPMDVATSDRYPHTRVASRAHTVRAGTDVAGDEEYSSSQTTPGVEVPGDEVTLPAGDGHQSCQTPPVSESQGDRTDTAEGDGFLRVHHVQQPHGDPMDVATSDRYPHTRVASRAHTVRAGTDVAGDEEYSSSQTTPGTEVPGDGVTVPVGDGHRSCQTPPVSEPQGDRTDTAEGDGHPASKHGSAADLPEHPVPVPVADDYQTSQADPDLESQNDASDVASDKGEPASQLGSRTDGLEDSVKEAPSLSPRTDRPLEVTWNPRDHQMAKNNAKPRKCFHKESTGLLKELLVLVEAAYKTRHESGEMEELQEGSSHEEPVSDEERGAVQSTGVPVLSTPRQYGSRHQYLEMNPSMHVDSNAPYPKAFWKYLIVCSMALSVLVAVVLCCAICLWRRRKQSLSAAPAAQSPTSSCPSLADSHQAHPSSPKTQTQSQQTQPVPPMLSHLP